MSTLLSEQTRAADLVGRYGGDEFLLVLPETSAEEAGRLAEKLRAALREQPFVTAAGEQVPQSVPASGSPPIPKMYPTPTGSIALADANLYASKRRGGDAVTGSEEERSLHDAEGGTFGLFESLVTAVDNKDRYTRRHSEEVTEYARRSAGSWASPRRVSGSCASPLCSTTSARSASPTASCASRDASRRRNTRSSRGTPSSARRSSP